MSYDGNKSLNGFGLYSAWSRIKGWIKTTFQTKITGGASTITDNNLTSGRALVSGSDGTNAGKVVESSVTATELGYLSGATSNIQTQLSGKASSTDLAAKAPLASPALTGTPTAPTASAGTNNTQIATTAFVTSAVAAAQTGAAKFQGVANNDDSSATPDIKNITNYKKGWYWAIGTAGTYAGNVCEAGDFIFCISDYTSAYSASDFAAVQTNIQFLTEAEIYEIIDSVE